MEGRLGADPGNADCKVEGVLLICHHIWHSTSLAAPIQADILFEQAAEWAELTEARLAVVALSQAPPATTLQLTAGPHQGANR